jgi:L-lactate dehydrogenase (cytochrome)
MIFNPHKLGIHKVLKYIPLNAVFDAPYKAAVKRAVNIADLRTIAKSRAHKVSVCPSRYPLFVVEKSLL